MKIMFLEAFGGRETKEIHYQPGQVVDFEDEDIAQDLVARGICQNVDPELYERKPVVVEKHGKGKVVK